MNESKDTDNIMTSYVLGVTGSVLGFILTFFFGNWGIGIGLVFMWFSLPFITFALTDDNLKTYSYFVAGIYSAYSGFLFIGAESIFTQLIFIVFTTLAISFFIIGTIHSFKKKESNKSKNFFTILGNALNILGLIYSIYSMIFNFVN